MDLGFTRFGRAAAPFGLAPDFAVLLVGIAARQAAAPTASRYAEGAPPRRIEALLAPAHGAFNAGVARMLADQDDK